MNDLGRQCKRIGSRRPESRHGLRFVRVILPDDGLRKASAVTFECKPYATNEDCERTLLNVSDPGIDIIQTQPSIDASVPLTAIEMQDLLTRAR